MDENEEEKRDIDVISGDGSEIDISPVYDHVILDKPNKNEKKEKIVIPKEIKENKTNNEKEKESDENINNDTDLNSESK